MPEKNTKIPVGVPMGKTLLEQIEAEWNDLKSSRVSRPRWEKRTEKQWDPREETSAQT